MRILNLEDDTNDGGLICRALATRWPDCQIDRVSSRAEFEQGLRQKQFDIIISDYKIAGFDGQQALALAQEATPGVPFLFFSGTISETLAVTLLKQGATDYVMKDSPDRLVPAVERAMKDVAEKAKYRETEAALRESEARFRTLVEQSLVGIYLIQAEQFSYVNPALAQILGYSPEEIVSRRVLEFIVPEDQMIVRENIQKRLAGDVSSVRYHLRMQRKDGSVAYAEACGTLIKFENSPAIIGTLIDITERKDFEAQFLRAQQVESIGAIAGGIAHDLNNVLAPISLGLRLLEDDASERNKAIIGHLSSAVQRGSDLVDQIRTFARGLQTTRLLLDVSKVIAETVDLVAQTFPRTITIRYTAGSEAWKINADPAQIRQVLLNLLMNARDAMPNGGSITIATENLRLSKMELASLGVSTEGRSFLLLSVQDTGRGMTPDVIAKIFDPFFTTKEFGKGTGLGLSTVSSIVKTHAGVLKVDSEPGQGTRFKVYFPTAQEEALPVAPVESLIPRGSNELILIVDDEEVFLSIAKHTLEIYGYRVRTAEDGAAGFSTFLQHKEDVAVVITDFAMPIIDGVTMARSISELNPRARVILSSGLPPERLDLPSNVVAILRKPYGASELLKELNRCLTHPMER